MTGKEINLLKNIQKLSAMLTKDVKKKLKNIELLQESLKKIFLMVIEKLDMGALVIIQSTGQK